MDRSGPPTCATRIASITSRPSRPRSCTPGPGTASYATKARAGVMAAIKTQIRAAVTTRSWLSGDSSPATSSPRTSPACRAPTTRRSGPGSSAIRTKDIGGHSAWYSLTGTHKDAPNNWGAHAGASRIAASLYLGDTADVAAAAKVTRGFLGDRSAYAGFRTNLDSDDWSWSCDGASKYTPVNRPCTKNGINIDGAFIADLSRSGSLTWPPGDTGLAYHVDALAAVAMQVELLYRDGQTGAWDWSSKALRRAAMIVQRSDADGGDGWNLTTASSQIPWLLNRRYGTFLPTRHQPLGRGIGFADWLWGSKSIANLPAPTTTKPVVVLSTTSTVPLSGVPVVVDWSLASTSDGLSRYDLQVQTDGGSWMDAKLASKTASSYRKTLATTSTYAFRVRAVDRSGRTGAWVSVGARSGWRVGDGASYIGWSGTWGLSTSSKYLDGKLHRSTATNASVTFTFSGSSIGWVSPVGPTQGKAQIFIDGTYQQTVDLYKGTYASRRLVYTKSFGQGKHTIRIHVVGTSGHPTVTVDGFYVVHD